LLLDDNKGVKTIESHVVWQGREEAHLTLEVDEKNQIQKVKLTGVGGPVFLEALKALRGQLKGDYLQLGLPTGAGAESLLIRELLLKAQGRWAYPFCEEELCHCRAVPTEVVDRAICAGAHTTRQVSEQTSASTACGTCRPDVEAIIKYRLSF